MVVGQCMLKDKLKMREHIYETHTNCEKVGCMICDGGLAICTICHLIEGSLTTECPGVHATDEQGKSVYVGELDFVGGQWVKGAASKASPAYWRLRGK